MPNEKPAVGIDLGTTFSVVASLDRDGKPNDALVAVAGAGADIF